MSGAVTSPASSLIEFAYWDVVYRRDAKSSWMDWGSYSTEEMAREQLVFVRERYPHYEVGLRKITKTVEHVDA